MDLGESCFLDVGNAQQFLLVHALRALVHLRHVVDRDAGDDRAKRDDGEKAQGQTGTDLHLFKHHKSS